MDAKDYQTAVEQFELARAIAPRDIFILRKLGRAYLELQERERVRDVIALITELDADACETDPELAGLRGRWYREADDLDHAEEIYRNALTRSPNSYYLANLLAQTILEKGETEPAGKEYDKAKRIVQRLENERNIWSLATLANADFFNGDIKATRGYLKEIATLKPSADEKDTIKDGLTKLESTSRGEASRSTN